MREPTPARSVPTFVSFFCPRSLIDMRIACAQRPFECPECAATFTRISHLKAHVRSHASESDKNYPCPEASCDQAFWTNQHLKKHIEVVHHGKTYNVSHMVSPSVRTG